MKKILALLIAITLTATLVGCGESNTDTDTNSAPKIEETTSADNEGKTEAVNMIDEAEAKEIVFADLSIQETAAKDLTVKLENNAYVIAFSWSGFDYQYTVDATTGEITETIFDGEVL